MKKVAKYLGGCPDSDAQMMKVFEFETQLAEVSKLKFNFAILRFAYFATLNFRDFSKILYFESF